MNDKTFFIININKYDCKNTTVNYCTCILINASTSFPKKEFCILRQIQMATVERVSWPLLFLLKILVQVRAFICVRCFYLLPPSPVWIRTMSGVYLMSQRLSVFTVNPDSNRQRRQGPCTELNFKHFLRTFYWTEFEIPRPRKMNLTNAPAIVPDVCNRPSFPSKIYFYLCLTKWQKVTFVDKIKSQRKLSQSTKVTLVWKVTFVNEIMEDKPYTA